MIIKHLARGRTSKCHKCHQDGLRWGHDTDRPGQRYCDKCDTCGMWVLINPETGTIHSCHAAKGSTHGQEPATTHDPIEMDPEMPPASLPAATPTQNTGDLAADALAALRAVLGPQQIDRSEVERIARGVIGDMVMPVRTIVVKDTITKEIEGTTHKILPKLVLALNAGEHVMMVGPAGTGKSTLAEQASEALNLRCYSLSLSPQTSAAQIIGYMSATGDYVTTLFRLAYELGGVFHFDEMDNSNPSTLTLINAALANGYMAFPDRMVKRHPDFKCVASANTYGKGATREFVGRQPIDDATLDRFAILDVPRDDDMERELCRATGLEETQVQLVLASITQWRDNVEKHGIRHTLSPRASVGMCRLLAGDMTWEDAVNARVRRGVTDAVWSKIIDG